MNGPPKSTRCATPSAHRSRLIKSRPSPSIYAVSTALSPKRARLPSMDKPVDHVAHRTFRIRDILHFAPGIALSAALAALAIGLGGLGWLQSHGRCTNRLF